MASPLSRLALKLPFGLEWLPPSTFLVGGALRDALLERQTETLDLDFVVPVAAVETARRIARHYQAGFVVLDEQRHIARVVFAAGTVDFAQCSGDSLATDLRRRDFTINAIAYSFHNNTLVDPLQGLVDLKQKTIKMISPANLQDDPLRLLRAYRQAAQLDFSIDPATVSTIEQLAPLLGTVAAERVRTELGYLLAIRRSDWLQAAWQVGLLQPWLPTLTREKLRQVARIDDAVHTLGATWTEFRARSEWSWLAKLACLVSTPPGTAEAELMALKYSRSQIRAIVTVLKHWPQLQRHRTAPLSLKEQYFLFLDVGNVFPVLALLATAIEDAQAIASLLDRYFNPDDPVAHPRPLVTGDDLLNALTLSPSPQIGRLLTDIQIAQIEGTISTRTEALEFAALRLQERQRDTPQ
ncbi:MAG: CCA tRNA nucleotidyltransferase [Cyanophyceae cyanobacterium]